MLENELDIVNRAKSGDNDAFELLVLEYQKRVYNLSFRMCKNEEDALDLSQEIFIRVYKSLAFFEGKSSFSTWLYSIASNACIDFSRRQKNSKLTPLYVLGDEADERPLDLPDLRYAPEDELLRTELRRDIADALAALTYEHREVLVLREINGLSYHEIADALELECGTVKSRICRARENLCKILSERGNKPSPAASKSSKRGEKHG